MCCGRANKMSILLEYYTIEECELNANGTLGIASVLLEVLFTSNKSKLIRILKVWIP